MRTRSLAPLLVVAAVVAVAPEAVAGRGKQRAARLRADSEFGIGPMLGAPSGLTCKYYFGGDTAVDFGIGAYHFGHRGGLHVHGDFLWHPVVLATTPGFQLPLHVGLGARIWDHGDYRYHGRLRYDDHTHFGLRAPVGISFYFTRVPFDVFFELALVVDFLIDADDPEDEHPDFEHGFADLNGAVGLRYYF